MKRKITLFLIIIFALGAIFTGCSESFSKVSVGGAKQDTSYAVLSNGGSAVQYGNYIYFINGYDGYIDEKGNSNKWGSVEKGAIYRAELIGSKVERDYSFFAADTEEDLDPDTATPGYETVTLNTFAASLDMPTPFKSTTVTVVDEYERDEDGSLVYDANDEKIPSIWHDEEVANVELIVPKRVGTSGYSAGGIYIFDDYIFYASPNNKKDKSGAVKTERTDFFRSKLDGSDTVKLYTSKKDTSSAEYMFFKQAGAYYLTVKDGTDVVSVKISGKKANKAITVAENVTAVHFPSKGIYYKGMNENTVQDFIYYVRPSIDTDYSPLGSVLEASRPNGKERFVISDGSSVTILGTDNGVLFYHNESGIITYTNLHNYLNSKIDGKDVSPTYIAAPGYQDDISGAFDGFLVSDYSSVKCIYPNVRSFNDPQVIGFKSDETAGIYLITKNDTTLLTASTGTFAALVGDMLYFFESSLKRVSLYSGADEEFITDKISTSSAFRYDILDDFVTYLGNPDDFAFDYRMFLNINGTAEPVFVGKLIEDDIKPDVEDEEEEESSKKGCGTFAVSPDKGGMILLLAALSGALFITLSRKEKSKAKSKR